MTIRILNIHRTNFFFFTACESLILLVCQGDSSVSSKEKKFPLFLCNILVYLDTRQESPSLPRENITSDSRSGRLLSSNRPISHATNDYTDTSKFWKLERQHSTIQSRPNGTNVRAYDATQNPSRFGQRIEIYKSRLEETSSDSPLNLKKKKKKKKFESLCRDDGSVAVSPKDRDLFFSPWRTGWGRSIFIFQCSRLIFKGNYFSLSHKKNNFVFPMQHVSLIWLFLRSYAIFFLR